MTAKNISLDRYKQRFFGDFLELPGLTEIAVNRPGELWTKIDGVWGQHTVDLKFDDCYNLLGVLQNTITIISRISNQDFLQPWNQENDVRLSYLRRANVTRSQSRSVNRQKFKFRIRHILIAVFITASQALKKHPHITKN